MVKFLSSAKLKNVRCTLLHVCHLLHLHQSRHLTIYCRSKQQTTKTPTYQTTSLSLWFNVPCFAYKNIMKVFWIFLILGMPPLVSIICRIRKNRRGKVESNARLVIALSLLVSEQQQQQQEPCHPSQQEVPTVDATVPNDPPDYNELISAERPIHSAPTEPPSYLSLSIDAHEIV